MRVPQCGRAIVRRLTPQDATRMFRPGDFLLTVSDGGLARVAGAVTGSGINHAALIVDASGALVEANPYLLPDARPYRVSSIESYLRAGKPCWIGYVELKEGTRQDVVAFARHFAEARGSVSLTGRLLVALHLLLNVAPRSLAERHRWLRPALGYFNRHALVLREESCFASGEFVARALERGGFLWERDPAQVTPADLFRRYAIADAPAAITPMPLGRRRASHASASRAPMAGRATVTRFVPRASVRGATALADDPRAAEEPQAGLHALLQVGIIAAAGLTVLSMLEQIAKAFASEG